MLAGLISRWTSPTAWAAQSPGDLPCDPQGLGHGQPSLALEPLIEALAPQSLHHQVGPAPMFADLVDGDDMVVLQRGGHLRLAQEPNPHHRAGPLGLEHLQRHLAPQDRVFRLEHQAHPPGTEQAQDAVPGEPAPLVRTPRRVENGIRVRLGQRQRLAGRARILARQFVGIPEPGLRCRVDHLPIRGFRRR